LNLILSAYGACGLDIALHATARLCTFPASSHNRSGSGLSEAEDALRGRPEAGSGGEKLRVAQVIRRAVVFIHEIWVRSAKMTASGLPRPL
jgi:hypothetical protein